MADAVTEVTVQTGSTSAEYGAYLGVAVNVVTKSGTNGFHGALFEYFQGDKLESRGYFDNRNLPESPKKSNQFGVQFDGPVDDSRPLRRQEQDVLHGRLRGAALQSRRRARSRRSRPTKMRAGDFSEVSTQIRNPYTKVPYPGNIIPQSDIAAQALELLQYYPQPNLPGLANNYQTDVLTENENDQVLLRVDQNIGQSARVYGRYNWVDAFDGFGAAVPTTATYQPRDEQEHVAVLSADDLADAAQRLPDRLAPPRFGHGEQLHLDGQRHGEFRPRHPGLRLRRALRQLRHPERRRSPGSPGLGAGGTNWYQFDTTFQMSNVLSWNKGTHNLRAGIDLRKLRDRPPCRQQPARSLRVHRRHDGPRGGRLHDRRAAHGRDAGRPGAGRRRPVAQRLLHQRRLAGDAAHDAEPRPALRAQHARADLRGRRLDAQRRPDADHPDDVPVRRASSSPSRTTRTGRRASGRPIA